MWEFIRDILLNPERNPGLIKWEDRTEGVFRFLKSEAVAQLWGKKKNNSSMTYEKLSRAMRYNFPVPQSTQDGFESVFILVEMLNKVSFMLTLPILFSRALSH